MKTEEMRYLIIRAASFRTLVTPSCSEGCLSQEIMTFPHKGRSSEPDGDSRRGDRRAGVPGRLLDRRVRTEVRAPALVVHGMEDPALPGAHEVALFEALSEATLPTLEGTGHELHRADWGIILDTVEPHTAS
jgi:pimeloyl-ACP methyl ester carboxylesterase